jgi:ACS family hexuronate transporter-like MFS transporter
MVLALVGLVLIWQSRSQVQAGITVLPGIFVLESLLVIAGVFMITVKRLRWAIAIMLCVAITNSYMDRGTLSLVVNAIRDSGDIPILDSAFARLNTGFLFAYALMYVGGGKLMDALGTRKGFFWITIFWSLAVISHGLAGAFASLLVCRILLGVGEGGGFPAITKAVAEWFPARERSTAIGLINAGSAFGGMLAPPLAAIILLYPNWPGAAIGLDDSWRWVFFLSGSTGFFWCIWWIWKYYPAREHASLSRWEREEIKEVVEADAEQHGRERPGIPWLQLFTYKQVWGLMLCKFLGDSVWYFIAFWLPKYLMDARGYDIKAVGAFAWMPWAGAGLGCLVVGFFSSWLIKRGLKVNASRKIALAVAVGVMPCLWLVPVIESNKWVILPFVIGYFGQQAWSTLVMTLPTDLFPRRAVGAVAGLVGFGGAMGGVIFGEISGWYLDRNPLDYGPIFAFAGVLHIVSFLVILVLIPRIEPLTARER